MIAPKNDPSAPEHDLYPVTKPRGGLRQVSSLAKKAQQVCKSEATQGYRYPELAQDVDLEAKIRQTAVTLPSGGSIRGRCTADDRRDVRVAKLQTVVARDGGRLVGEARTIECRVKPGAASIAGEQSAGPIPAVRGRCQAHHEETTLRVAKAWYGTTPIFPFAKATNFLPSHSFPVTNQARTEPALDDASAEARQRAGWDGYAFSSAPHAR